MDVTTVSGCLHLLSRLVSGRIIVLFDNVKKKIIQKVINVMLP